MSACTAVALLAVCASGVASMGTPPYPYFASDSTGDLHINTTSPNQNVFVNGINVLELYRDVQELKALVGVDVGSGSRGRITDVLDVEDGSVYLSAPNGVYLSSNTTHMVAEKASGWNPSSLIALVGDYVTFQWSSLEAVYETQSDGSTAVAGGYSSGDATVSGEFTVRLLKPQKYHFRAANKGFVCTVDARAGGAVPNNLHLQVGVDPQYSFHIVGFGREDGYSCYNEYGAMYEGSSGCACKVGSRVQAFYSNDELIFCVSS